MSKRVESCIMKIWLSRCLGLLNVSIYAYIGVNSLTYYYLHTGLLLVIITIMNKIGITGFWFVFPLYLIVVILLTIASEIILRFALWMVGYSQINK